MSGIKVVFGTAGFNPGRTGFDNTDRIKEAFDALVDSFLLTVP